ncbi:MAG: AAA family ATPase [Planctomycetota bacterium]|nr:AAA family ATPase [Planctomycetota bacterium]
MLIRSLEAENFMKFERLRLAGLPSHGVIGIEGPNESGKSTIAEALFFGFFGRSGDSRRAVEQLIRWESNHMRVEVEFALRPRDGDAEGAGDYVIFREVDRFGTNYVKLLSLPDRGEVATGNLQVAEFIKRRLKFEVQEFLLAFYHSQREPRLGDSSLVQFVETVSGVTQMENARADITREVEQLERQFVHYQKDIGRNLRQIEHYSRGVTKLPEFEERVQNVSEEQESLKRQAAERKRALDVRRKLLGERERCHRLLAKLVSPDVENRMESVRHLLEYFTRLEGGNDESRRYFEENRDYFRGVVDKLRDIEKLFGDYEELSLSFQGEYEKLQASLDDRDGESLSGRSRELEEAFMPLEARLRRARRGVYAWGTLSVVVSAASLIAAFLPEARSWLATLPLDSQLCLEFAGGVAGISIVLFLYQLLRRRGLRIRLEETRDHRARLAEKIEEARQDLQVFDRLGKVRDSGKIVEFLSAARTLAGGVFMVECEEFDRAHATLCSSGRGGKESAYPRVLTELATSEEASWRDLARWVQGEGKTIKDLEARARKARSERDRLENELRDFTSQASKKRAIESKNGELEEAAGRIQSDIDDRRVACKLLQDTSATLRKKLGPALGNLIRAVLPELTEGRYRDVRVRDNLEIEVFAAAKRDFLPASELSGGTTEALLLALRLAFSQCFVGSRSRRPQFVLLDEPFKMMDGSRVLSTLEALRRLSPDLAQVFVIQPSYSEGQRRKFDYHIRTSLETTCLEVGAPSS